MDYHFFIQHTQLCECCRLLLKNVPRIRNAFRPFQPFFRRDPAQQSSPSLLDRAVLQQAQESWSPNLIYQFDQVRPPHLLIYECLMSYNEIHIIASVLYLCENTRLFVTWRSSSRSCQHRHILMWLVHQSEPGLDQKGNERQYRLHGLWTVRGREINFRTPERWVSCFKLLWKRSLGLKFRPVHGGRVELFFWFLHATRRWTHSNWREFQGCGPIALLPICVIRGRNWMEDWAVFRCWG